MKIIITEQEKKQILSLYKDKNTINEIDLSFLTSIFKKNKVKKPFFIVQEDPQNKGKFRLYIKDNANPSFTPIDAEKLLGKSDTWKYYDDEKSAQKDADIQNKTISGEVFKSDPFINLPAQFKTLQQEIRKRGYIEIVDKINLPDGNYYEEGFRTGDWDTVYNPEDPKAFVHYDSFVYKIKNSSKPDASGDTGYCVLTSHLAKDPPLGSTVTLKDGIPNSSYWGDSSRIISMHKNPRIAKS